MFRREDAVVDCLRLLRMGFIAAAASLCLFISVHALAQVESRPVASEAGGVNIHFTRPLAGEVKMLADAGIHWVRMDFFWNSIEKAPGKYDFAEYDRLMESLVPYGIRPLFILDYTNPLYDNGLSAYTEEGRKAFAQWAAASVGHFRGRGIIWEMYNEPNGRFWLPKRNVQDYIKLAKAVGEAIRKAAPGEIYIGPATVGFDIDFLAPCLESGLLEYWSAVSVHPYRLEIPETATEDYRQLANLIAKFAPRGKRVPIISSEWGYTTAWKGIDDEAQGKILARQWLVNLMNGVPLSIWYDWEDDHIDPALIDAHFGTVFSPYLGPQQPVYRPKPAYFAMRTFTTQLKGYRFVKRLAAGALEDYVLAFGKGNDIRLVAWSTSPLPHAVRIPASMGRFFVTGYMGEKLQPIYAGGIGLAVDLTDAPQYLVPENPNEVLRRAAGEP